MSKHKSVEEFSAQLNAKWDRRMVERQRKRPAREHLTWHTELSVLQERDVSIPAMGLMGEAGEAGEHFKKYIRDGKPIHRNRKLALELGDVLHYLCRCVDLAGYSLGEIIALNEQKIARREKRNIKHV